MGAKNMRLAALWRFALAITVFNILGHLWLGFEQAWAHPFVALLASYATELLLETVEAWSQKRPTRYSGGGMELFGFLLPAHITGMAVSMLLYPGDRLAPVAFAAAVAIGSKYLLRAPLAGQSRHFLNPSNFGITITLLAFPWVGIAMPYMFTENLYGWGDWILPMIMIVSGSFLNIRFTKKIPLIIAWLSAFALQGILRGIFLDGPVFAGLMPMTGVAFILFTFYMVSDPSTTPRSRQGQIVFGASVAFVYGLLLMGHIVFTLFFSLTLVCLARGGLLWAQEMLAARQKQEGPQMQAEPETVLTASSVSGVLHQ